MARLDAALTKEERQYKEDVSKVSNRKNIDPAYQKRKHNIQKHTG